MTRLPAFLNRTLFAGMSLALAFCLALIPGGRSIAMVYTSSDTNNGASWTDYKGTPLTSVATVPPLVMMVMSRDEQLFIKAYTDYTDLNNDGKIDATYEDSFDYSGYFDPNLCYAYSSSRFKASAKATDTNGNGKTHECSSAWSGNFLNWLAMSRMDMVRYVLYGGLRSTDSSSQTVLERAHIPNDLHAWAKVYTGNDVNFFTPYSQDSGKPGISFCNASFSTTDTPHMRIARGSYPEWAATATSQCQWANDAYTSYSNTNGCSGAAGDNSCYDDAPKSAELEGDNGLTVRVEVCDPGTSAIRESFCQKYGTASWKPIGLLQQYGESGKLRFGLMTGSFSKPRSGGVLRRNIGKLAGNGSSTTTCTGDDEIKLSDGTFCSKSSTDEGIIKSLNAFKLTQWDGSKWSDCGEYSILNRQGQSGTPNNDGRHLNNPGANSGLLYDCSAWGNPLSEMYAEALRYISGEKAATSNFTGGTDLTGLPSATWKDPYGKDPSSSPATPRNPYCADCSVLVLSTGLNSFDGDEIPAISVLGGTTSSAKIAAATKTIGKQEGISDSGISVYVGRSLNHLVGTTSDTAGPAQTGSDLRVGQAANTHEDICTAKTVDDLSQVRGICADIPAQEGSYLIDGLAYKAWTTDMRPDLKSATANVPIPKPADYVNKIQTYAVALAENLPKFDIPVGDNTISLVPLCQANNTGTAAIADGGWRSCYLGNVTVGSKTASNNAYIPLTSTTKFYQTYGRSLEADGSAGSFSLVWEDSQWGNDHDNDVVSMITYCVGAKCSAKTTRYINTVSDSKVCFYKSTGSSGTSLCPTGNLSSMPNGWNDQIESVKISAGYSATIYQDNNYGGSSLVLGPGTYNLSSNYRNWTSSIQVRGPYDGYDICWRSTSAACGADGKPNVGANDVLVRVENLSAYAGNAMLTGYAVSGSNSDGVKRLTLRPGNENDSILTQSVEPRSTWATPQVVKYSASSSEVKQLENPLFYAAKYGGFSYNTDAINPLPTTASSWDSKNNETGALGADGLPDNFFPVRNPGTLKERLTDVFNNILRRVASGTAAAVVANAREGEGAIYQALYEPTHLDARGQEVRWIGAVQALFVDQDGNLREDGDGNGILGDFTADPAVEIFFDTDRVTRFRRFTGAPNEAHDNFTVHELKELRSIWNARDRLSAMSDDEVMNQRHYSDPANQGRYIFTALKTNLNDELTDDDVVDFTSDGLGSGKWGILNEKKKEDADSLITYIRGKAVTGLRSREVDDDNSGNKKTMRLGDVVNSTPTVVGTPSESFDLLYNDGGYAKFRKQYQDRRNVVYVGANDGMIHAFNAGFYDNQAKQFKTTPTIGTATAHPLGSELWAYIPYNLLPHLPWLADPEYNHVWYVDGAPRVFDARIFADDDDHPDGWGTVLVIGFRLGGKSITLDRNKAENSADAFGSFTPVTQTSFSTHPAYVVMDITNPEVRPTLLAEITGASATDASLGYTTGFPTVIAMNSKGNADGATSINDKWYLAMGSGPTSVSDQTVSSAQNAKLYIYDLKAKSFADGFAPKDLGSSAANSFVGDPVSVDWDLDFKADALYFGTIGTPDALINSQTGELFKLGLGGSSSPGSWSGPYVLVNPGKPVVSTPSVTFDESGNKWVFAGTGRFIAVDDKTSTASQSIFGVIDYKTTAPSAGAAQYNYTNFVDVTNAKVATDGTVRDVSVGGAAIGTEAQLANKIAEVSDTNVDRGWKLGLSTSSGIAERSVTQTSLLGDILYATSYIPSNDQCAGEGTSNLYGLFYKTGAAKSNLATLGETDIGGSTPYTEVNRSVSIGAGLAASPSLHLGGARDQRGLTIFVQTSTGAITPQEGKVGANAKNGEIDWREIHQ